MHISVAMATYNGERFLEEQLRSIMRQTVLPDELVVGDDGSSDRTLEILEHMREESPFPIKVNVNPERLGFARNFRQTVNGTRGDIIFLCDQDDIWMADKIERMMRLFELHPEILSLSSSYRMADETGTPIFSLEDIPKARLQKVSWKSFIRHPRYPGMAMAFRRNLWERIGEEEWSPSTSHDWIINEKAALSDGLYKCSDKLVYYRQHKRNTQGTLMTKDSGKKLRDRVRMIGELRDDLLPICCPEQGKKRFLRKQVEFQEKRIRLLEERKAGTLLLHELLHPTHITLRAVAGDLFALKKR